ncbi:AraC family transcriptional regulator [Paenibacillus rubinfantis]|uniref:AraC family transcriptional regulator n=1 Tax=Paenibacillus rubinfantis TaxID=1720296 RepID=UPI00073ED3A9|nr:AraC family transcriptional regulator [Paenibacillus rubinfantis]
MDLKKWRNEMVPVLNKICGEIAVGDAVVDWVDIVIEQTGGSGKCPPHAHTWYEFNYVLSGRMQTRFIDQDVMVYAGEFFLIPPGMTHAHDYSRDDPHEGICLRWRFRPYPGTAKTTAETTVEVAVESTPEGMTMAEATAANDSFLRRLIRMKEWPPGAYRDEYGIRSLLMQFFTEAESGRSPFYQRLLLVQLLEVLSGVTDARQTVSASEPLQAQDALLRKVEVYLEDFRGDRLNVEALAASLHMSYGHLSRLYKQKTGRTLIEEMNRIRLSKACELLKQPSLLIKEVAEQAGFPDIYYFSKAFKKKYGVSPLTYRKQQFSPSR